MLRLREPRSVHPKTMVITLVALTVLQPVRFTASVRTDADDPAIWVNAKNRTQSRVIGTDKAPYPNGGLYVFDLKGRIVQHVGQLDRPNNVDVQTNCRFGARTVDLAVATERGKRRLRIWTIDHRTGKLSDVTGKTRVFTDSSGEQSAPMGIALFLDPESKRTYAFVSRKQNTGQQVIGQYELVRRGDRIDLAFKRYLGNTRSGGEVEALYVDDAEAVLYYAEEPVGYHRFDLASSGSPEQVFATESYDGDREGIASYKSAHGTYLLTSEQRDNANRYRVYSQEPKPKLLAILDSAIDATDGLDATSESLGPEFPNGLVVVMNSKAKNFAYISPWFLRRKL